MKLPGRTAAVAMAGAAAAAGVGYAAQRRKVSQWRAAGGDLAAAGLSLPEDIEHHYVSTDDGGKIHAISRGSGPTVVLVHGITLSSATWAPQLWSLADTHRVIAIDQRGHGESLAGTDPYSFSRLGEDLYCVLEALEVDCGVVVGHSMGGMIAQTLAIERELKADGHIGGLMLVATAAGGFMPVPGSDKLLAALSVGAGRRLTKIETKGAGILPTHELGSWLIRSTFGSSPTPAALELTRALTGSMSPSALSQLLGPLLAFNITHRIDQIDIPTEVIVGSRDSLTPPRFARVMASGIPGAHLTVYPGCGHMVMLERPTELNAAISRFVDEVGAGVAPRPK